MAIGAGIAAVGSITQGVIGATQISKANRALENYERQEFKNVADGLEVSTLGADLRREELARVSATSVDALQQSGVRGIVGGASGILDRNIDLSRDIGADLDKQIKEIQRIRAQDEARIRELQEAREIEDLRGLGQQKAVGQQNLIGGIQGLSTSLAGMYGTMGQGEGQSNTTEK